MDRRFQIDRQTETTARKARKGAWRGSALRRTLPVALAAVAVCGLTACGSSQTATSNRATDSYSPIPTHPYNAPLQTGTATPTDNDPLSTANNSPAADSSTLTHVGQLTVSTNGSSVTTDLSIAPATPSTVAQPPAEVLDACNWSYAPTLAQSVFIHGRLTITYSGKLPEAVTFVSPQLVDLKTGALLDTNVTIQGTDGSWGDCGGFGTTLQPGQSVTTEMWINYQLLSNTHPTFSPSDVDGLALQSGAVDADEAGLGIGDAATATGGPGAATCSVAGDNPTATLLFFSTPPYTYTTHNETGTQLTGACASS